MDDGWTLPIRSYWLAAVLVTMSLAIAVLYIQSATRDRYTQADHDAYAAGIEARLRALEQAAR